MKNSLKVLLVGFVASVTLSACGSTNVSMKTSAGGSIASSEASLVNGLLQSAHNTGAAKQAVARGTVASQTAGADTSGLDAEMQVALSKAGVYMAGAGAEGSKTLFLKAMNAKKGK